MTTFDRRGFLAVCGAAAWSARCPAAEVLPKHVTPATQAAVRQGLDYLARTQAADGGWRHEHGSQGYPAAMTALAGTSLMAHGNTCTRGRYAANVQGAVDYLSACSTASGLLTGPNRDNGQPMHGHGFALQFLAMAFPSVKRGEKRERLRRVINNAIMLTAQGQSSAGGWLYNPGDGDEGSVTVTQVQALRACQNAGFVVPRGTVERAVRYVELCGQPDGGICYSLGSGGASRLPISAAAVATLYNAGEFDAPIAERCLKFVHERFELQKGWNKDGGHDWYCHLYAAQGFYMAGDKYWDKYFPETRDQLLGMQNKGDGSWNGDGVGTVYGTAIACIILQLPYKFLPVYQR